jgi:hypothetical protein
MSSIVFGAEINPSQKLWKNKYRSFQTRINHILMNDRHALFHGPGKILSRMLFRHSVIDELPLDENPFKPYIVLTAILKV